MNTAMNTAIAIENVVKRFNGVVAVNDLDLTVPRGSLYGFIGPNGSGKTTTLRMIMHILLARLGGNRGPGRTGHAGGARSRQLLARGARALQADVGAAAPALLRLAQRGAPARARSVDRPVAGADGALGLDRQARSTASPRAWHRRSSSSRRCSTSRELLILDEPFTGLDPVNAEVLKDAVLDLKKAGTTIVFSTHDMGVAERLCDRIFMIFKGRKVLDGTLDEIQSIYGHDTIRLRTDEGVDALSRTGRDRRDQRPGQPARKCAGRAIPRRCSRPLMARTRVTHFEVDTPVAARHLRADRGAARAR